MGTSNWQNISYCCELIYRVAPRRILDVGTGALGRWSLLAREFADVWRGRVLAKDWACVVDGIEAFAPQIQPLHRTLYDHIYLGDAFEVIDRLDYYDLVILGDVIEHFPPERARPMLGKCLARAQFVMVNAPLGTLDDWPQEDGGYGNRWEEHRTMFTLEDFLRGPDWRVVQHRLFEDYDGRSHGVFLLRSRYLGRSRIPDLESP